MKSVLIGLSGGVDSAVSALLLKKQGYKVIGAFMRNFSDNKNLKGECHWVEDKKDAEKIASILKIPLLTFNFENEYKRDVIEPMFNSYSKNLTPNPDTNCNRYIKFPLLWKEAQKRDIDFIATGHYAKIIKKKNKFELHQAIDKEKDQTYFLYKLKEQDLKHTLFPIGNLKKSQVREIAKKANLPVYNKRGSRGICFVGKMDMKTFLKQRIKEKKGIIKNPEGEIIGTHTGTMFFTIGERIKENEEIHLNDSARNKASKKFYVAKKQGNTLIVAPENNLSLKRKQFIIKNLSFINKNQSLKNIKVRIRHRGNLISATIKKEKNQITCTLKNPTQGIAEGQSVVIYKNSKVLAGGEIR
ncbi:MAG: tRNA 2-thiouridine(34) synthase MnmA [Nanoarchaeota archaeon]